MKFIQGIFLYQKMFKLAFYFYFHKKIKNNIGGKKICGIKFSEYKPKEWHYCYLWFGKNKRCFLGKENRYYKELEEAAKKWM